RSVGDGAAVSVGDTLTYTLTVTVANAATTADEVLVDTLGDGLTAGAVPAGCLAAGQVVTCTLPAGSAIGIHSFVYTATVDADAETSVATAWSPTTAPAGHAPPKTRLNPRSRWTRRWTSATAPPYRSATLWS